MSVLPRSLLLFSVCCCWFHAVGFVVVVSMVLTVVSGIQVSLLRRNCTVEEAENLVKQLDNDQDGKSK